MLPSFASAPRALVQCKCACGGTPGPTGECEECRKKRLSLQQRAGNPEQGTLSGHSMPPIVHEALRSPGQPLDSAKRTFFESRSGHDFSAVRVHTDRQAAAGARAVEALAYVGREVVFGKQLGLQTKLNVCGPQDSYELEANRIADQVIGTPAAAIAVAPARPRISRKCAAREQEEEEKKRRKLPFEASAAADMPAGVQDALGSHGQRLDDATRTYFERRFGHDFSRVRVHTGVAAQRSAQDVNARAYTVGRDIVFAPGEFLPGTQAGRRLLAHELTHVVQQAGGGASSGPAQERDAVAAAQAVETGEIPSVRTRSRVGLAAQPKTGLADPELYKAIDPKNAGLRVVTVLEVEAIVNRVIKAPGAKASEGRADFNASPTRAKANLLHTHFRDENERLSYALGAFTQFLGVAGGDVDPNALFVMLREYETQRLTQAGAIIVHTPPTKEEQRRLTQARAEVARREYQAYLAEIARFNAEADARTVYKTGRYSGAATVDLYQQFVGAPVEALAETLKEEAAPMTSLMIDFIPVIGQIKGLIEGIVGKDLITGAELPAWQRGLGILLAIIPEAKGIFSAGRNGIRILARVAVDSGEDAAKVYRAATVAGRLSEEEVQAAEHIVAGARPTPAQVRIARDLQEIESGIAAQPVPLEPLEKGAAKGGKALATELENIKQTTHLAGRQHTLSLKRFGRRLIAWLCSNGCGPLIEKAEAMLAKLPDKHAARGPLRKFIGEARKEATWIDDLPGSPEAKQKLAELTQQLEDMQKRFPGVVDPDIPVPPAAPAEPAPLPEPPAAEPAPPAQPRVRPEELDPPGTQYKRPVAGQTGKEAATDIPSWVKNEHYPSPRVGEHSADYAARILDHKYGPGNWQKGPTSEYNQIEKWARRHFEDPPAPGAP
jgi:hypothetical protein